MRNRDLHIFGPFSSGPCTACYIAGPTWEYQYTGRVFSLLLLLRFLVRVFNDNVFGGNVDMDFVEDCRLEFFSFLIYLFIRIVVILSCTLCNMGLVKGE